MLDEVKPDIVAIAPRWVDQHRDMTVAAAERGIHIFMEKPFCRSPAEADEIVAACERTHTKLAIAHQTRYSPKIDVVRDMIAQGQIGRVLELRGRGKEDQRGGGEDLFVLGSHIMNLIRTFGGDPTWCFGSLSIDGRSVGRADVKEGPEGLGPLAGDTVRAMYGLPNGVTAYFNSVRGSSGQSSRFGLVICGSAGLIEIQTGYVPNVKYLDDPNWSPGRSGKVWQDVSTAGLGQPEPLTDGSAAGRQQGGRAGSDGRDPREPRTEMRRLRRALDHRNDHGRLRFPPPTGPGRACHWRTGKMRWRC